MLVWPFPKSHDQLVISPVDLSAKFTVSGASPMVGDTSKLAAGGKSPFENLRSSMYIVPCCTVRS